MQYPLLIATQSDDPEMIKDPNHLLIDLAGSGPIYFWKEEALRALRSAFPAIAKQVEKEGSFDGPINEGQRQAFLQMLTKLHAVSNTPAKPQGAVGSE